MQDEAGALTPNPWISAYTPANRRSRRDDLHRYNLGSFASVFNQYPVSARHQMSRDAPEFQPSPSRVGHRFAANVSPKKDKKEAKFMHSTTEISDRRYLLKKMQSTDEHRRPAEKPMQKESLLQWFDRVVESELKKRSNKQHSTSFDETMLRKSKMASARRHSVTFAGIIPDTSQLCADLAEEAKLEQTTELTDAVANLAKAEAISLFTGAVRAAEEAAAKAPPGLAEEAAAASARSFEKTECKIVNTVKENFPGEKPIEVIGYVGVTKPKMPKKSK